MSVPSDGGWRDGGMENLADEKKASKGILRFSPLSVEQIRQLQ